VKFNQAIHSTVLNKFDLYTPYCAAYPPLCLIKKYWPPDPFVGIDFELSDGCDLFNEPFTYGTNIMTGHTKWVGNEAILATFNETLMQSTTNPIFQTKENYITKGICVEVSDHDFGYDYKKNLTKVGYEKNFMAMCKSIKLTEADFQAKKITVDASTKCFDSKGRNLVDTIELQLIKK